MYVDMNSLIHQYYVTVQIYLNTHIYKYTM